jgi:predicted cupin superfamily sugar epimerase
MTRLSVEEVVEHLGLEPLPGEGGFYRQTYIVPNPDPEQGHAPLTTAILFLETPESWSGLHLLESDEIFHFYMGDPCRMVVCSLDGEVREHLIGSDLGGGCAVQVVVPGNHWQGTKLAGKGEFGYALLGTTMTPGFRQDQFHLARESTLSGFTDEVAAQLRPFLAPGA